MGNIWYESHLHFKVMDFVPFIVLGGTILLFILEINYLKKRYSAPEQGVKIAKIFFPCVIAFESILFFKLTYSGGFYE